MQRSHGSSWPTHVALVGLLALSGMQGCGSADRQDRAVIVDFPSTRPQQAVHCHTILRLQAQRLEQVGGDVIGRWVASDVVKAQQAASAAVDPAVGLGSHEKVASLVRQTMDAFDANGDSRIESRGELEELARHVDRCMEEFGSR